MHPFVCRPRPIA